MSEQKSKPKTAKKATRKRPKKTTPPSREDSTHEVAQPPPLMNEEGMAALMQLIAPVVEFHKEIEDATEDDLRFYWEAHLVKGKNTPLCKTSGTSSLPKALTDGLSVNTPALIEQEVMEKIAKPLIMELQKEAERRTGSKLIELRDSPAVPESQPTPTKEATDAAAMQTAAEEETGEGGPDA